MLFMLPLTLLALYALVCETARVRQTTHHEHVSAGDTRPHALQVHQDLAVRLGARAVAAGAEEVDREALWHRLYAPGQVCVTETTSVWEADGRSCGCFNPRRAQCRSTLLIGNELSKEVGV